MKSKKKKVGNTNITSEKESRKNMLNMAKVIGRDIELKQIFDKYDNLLAGCTNEGEAKAIKVMALAEIHKLFDFKDALVVDGITIIPAKSEEYWKV